MTSSSARSCCSMTTFMAPYCISSVSTSDLPAGPGKGGGGGGAKGMGGGRGEGGGAREKRIGGEEGGRGAGDYAGAGTVRG